jgi:hypothetical protein
MKKYLLMAVVATGLLFNAQAQTLKTPAPSPTQTVKQDFALAQVELSYSRPGVKGRKIFGDIVPFGKVWRTGANSATTITFGEDVLFGGKKVAAGKYGLLSIPGATEWTIILSKQLDVTSPAAYKEDQDVIRVTAKPMALPMLVENFMILFDDIKPNSANLELLWEKTGIAIPITVELDAKVMAQIDNLMNKDNKPYFNAGMYYMENGKDLNQSLTWFNKAIEQNPTAFWMHYQKAVCLSKMGKKQEAVASANKSIELAKVAKNDDYVALNEKLLATLK